MTSPENGQGQLVLAGDRLVAVLVYLSDPEYGSECGKWFLEAGFGPCSAVMPPVFADLGAAGAWLDRRLGDSGFT